MWTLNVKGTKSPCDRYTAKLTVQDWCLGHLHATGRMLGSIYSCLVRQLGSFPISILSKYIGRNGPFSLSGHVKSQRITSFVFARQASPTSEFSARLTVHKQSFLFSCASTWSPSEKGLLGQLEIISHLTRALGFLRTAILRTSHNTLQLKSNVLTSHNPSFKS